MADSAQSVGSERTHSPRLTTRELGSREGHQQWAHALKTTYCEMGLEWSDPRGHFDGELAGRQFGDIFVSTVRADPHSVLRTPAMIDSDGVGDYLLTLITRGSAELRQDDRSTLLGDAAFAILDTARPFVFSSHTEFEQVVVRIPRKLLTTRLPLRIVDHITASQVSARSGTGSVVSNLLQHIATLDDNVPTSAAVSFSSSALDMLVTALAEAPIGVSITDLAHAHDLRKAKHALETHMHDPERSVTDIARELGMSVRYLQYLFRAEGSTPSGWLYQARLERARKMLLNSKITVRELSTYVGFRDISHFSRSFRRQFGTSPGQYRSEHSAT